MTLLLIGMAAESQTATTDEPTRTDIYQVLSHDRRRYVLHYLLKQEDNTTTKYALSKQIAAWENGIRVEEVTSSQRKRVYIALHQNHLPMMADRNVIEYSDDGEVVLADEVDNIDIYLDVVRGGNIPWSQFYLGLGLIGSAATAVAWAGLVPFSVLPGYAWAVVVALAVAITGAVHVYVGYKHRLGNRGPPPELDGGPSVD